MYESINCQLGKLKRPFFTFLLLCAVTAHAQEAINLDIKFNIVPMPQPQSCPELGLVKGSFHLNETHMFEKPGPAATVYCVADLVYMVRSTYNGLPGDESALICPQAIPEKLGDVACKLAKNYDPSLQALGNRIDAINTRLDDLEKANARAEKNLK